MKGVIAMAIDTYKYRKTHGLCMRCGRKLTDEEKQFAQCPACRAMLAERTRNYRERLEEAIPVVIHSSTYTPPTYSLSDVVKMAKANDLSYGNMVAVLEGRTALRRTFHYRGVTKITPKEESKRRL